jgi:hypothetical protein
MGGARLSIPFERHGWGLSGWLQFGSGFEADKGFLKARGIALRPKGPPALGLERQRASKESHNSDHLGQAFQ